MIGQDSLLTQFNQLIEAQTLPRFIMLVGHQGSGRKTIAKYIADKLNAPLYKPENNKVNVEYVRDIITQAYKQNDSTVYLLPDVDYFNKSAANALLKVTEEPPNNAYFIMTCVDGRSVPTTLRSRCTEYRLAVYSRDTLREFAESINFKIDYETLSNCLTPGDIVNLSKSTQDFKELEVFVNKVLDNIGKVSGANVFKIDDSIAFKEEDTGYNLNSFWTIFSNVCMQRTKDIKNSKRNMYFSFIRITGEYRGKLLITGLNKRSLFDLWLLEIRDTYRKYN